VSRGVHQVLANAAVRVVGPFKDKAFFVADLLQRGEHAPLQAASGHQSGLAYASWALYVYANSEDSHVCIVQAAGELPCFPS
jgi:hypothetical protein